MGFYDCLAYESCREELLEGNPEMAASYAGQVEQRVGD